MMISRSLKELGSTEMAEAKGKVDLEGRNEAINILGMVSLSCMLDTQGGGIYGFGVQKRDVNYREIFEYHQHRGI